MKKPPSRRAALAAAGTATALLTCASVAAYAASHAVNTPSDPTSTTRIIAEPAGKLPPLPAAVPVLVPAPTVEQAPPGSATAAAAPAVETAAPQSTSPQTSAPTAQSSVSAAQAAGSRDTATAERPAPRPSSSPAPRKPRPPAPAPAQQPTPAPTPPRQPVTAQQAAQAVLAAKQGEILGVNADTHGGRDAWKVTERTTEGAVVAAWVDVVHGVVYDWKIISEPPATVVVEPAPQNPTSGSQQTPAGHEDDEHENEHEDDEHENEHEEDEHENEDEHEGDDDDD